MTRARVGWRWVAAGMLAAASPALADVKAGVEAWSRGDYARAVAEWRGPALAGDADAQFNMGQAYKLGRGVPADLTQAETWYQKAAVQGHAQAQDNYGLALFQDGRKADALPWLEKSAARDEKRTELVLGTMLFNGDSVPKDWVRAYALVSRSSQQGLPQASQTLAQMDGYLSPEQRQQGSAFADRIADQGRSARLAAMAAPSTVLPRMAERPDRSPVRTGTSSGAVMATAVPSSTAPSRHSDAARSGAPAPSQAAQPVPAPANEAPHQATASQASPRSAARAARPQSPAPAAAAGHWKVQLGAFRDEGNARALWAKLAGRVGGRAIYERAGGIVRLQAGPFASKAEAERACRGAGSGCVIVP